jgi:hypothetical protein
MKNQKARDYYHTDDTVVGQFVEGLYCWNEYCLPHAASYLLIHEDRKHRDITIHEVANSWREFRCYACNKLLWNMEMIDPPMDPFPKPSAGVVVKG